MNPHSPFQKLIEARRLKLGLSIRDLADRISEATPQSAPLNPGSLWIWLRNQNGFPHPKSATRPRLSALATILRVPLPRLKETLDASRHLFTAREEPVPVESQNGLDSLIEILANDKRAYVSRTRLLNIARSLRAGSNADERT